MKHLNKKGVGNGLMWAVVIGIFVIAGLIVFVAFVPEEPTPPLDDDPGGIRTPSGITCPDTLIWDGTTSVRNRLNSTGNEEYDTTIYFYDAATGALKNSFTDTTAGSTPLSCGTTYNVEVLSTNGEGGDSAEILGVSEGIVLANGVMQFTATGNGNRITIDMNQRGLSEVRAKDLVNGNFMVELTGGSITAFSANDPSLFIGDSATTNASIPVGVGGELNVVQFLRAVESDVDFNDLGVWILIDAAPTVWDTDGAILKLDGTVLVEASDELNIDERRAYSDYELVYKIPADREITTNKDIEVELSLFALSGQDPTFAHNVSWDYAPIGKYLSTEQSNVLKIGAVDDSAQRSDVYTRFDTEIGIS